MNDSRKDLRDRYKQTTISAGVYQIRNITSGRIFLGSANNLPGIINSNRFQLRSGTHPNKALQEDWNISGADNFVFETLDELKTDGDAAVENREELKVLLDLWLEKLMPYGERGYNQPEKK